MELFDFNKQLTLGDKGEVDFIKKYAAFNPVKSKDLKYDFLLMHSLTVELKTDSYDMNKTSNFFMEKDSNETGKLGGPWRALQDNIDYFVYYFIINGVYFWFKPCELCPVLDKLILDQNMSQVKIQNKGWVTSGYKINRNDVQSCVFRRSPQII